MKYFVAVVLCSLVAAAIVEGQGVPTKKCPAGEHSVLYCPRKAEPDCSNPQLHDPVNVGACGIPDCFCDQNTVRDPSSGKCVPLAECPTKTETQCE